MDKNLKNRLKQLIGESFAEDRQPLLSSENVTDEKLADQLSEIEAKKAEVKTLAEMEEQELSEGWDESEEIVSEGDGEEGICDHKEGETCPNCEPALNESEDTVFDLSFLNEKEEK